MGSRSSRSERALFHSQLRKEHSNSCASRGVNHTKNIEVSTMPGSRSFALRSQQLAQTPGIAESGQVILLQSRRWRCRNSGSGAHIEIRSSRLLEGRCAHGISPTACGQRDGRDPGKFCSFDAGSWSSQPKMLSKSCFASGVLGREEAEDSVTRQVDSRIHRLEEQIQELRQRHA